jgi:26S proteasome regulatory subunit N10
MKNGDYTPSRFEAQNDAVGIIANAKLDSNQENLVAVMAAAGTKFVFV